jgi:hypothetical protein
VHLLPHKGRIPKLICGVYLILACGFVVAAPEGQSMLTQTLFKQLDELHDNLKLSSEQELLWSLARMQSLQTERDIRENNRSFTRLSEHTLQSETPPLADLSLALDDLLMRNQALHKKVRILWLNCYNSLGKPQKLVVHGALQRQLARLKTFQQLRDFFRRD